MGEKDSGWEDFFSADLAEERGLGFKVEIKKSQGCFRYLPQGKLFDSP